MTAMKRISFLVALSAAAAIAGCGAAHPGPSLSAASSAPAHSGTPAAPSTRPSEDEADRVIGWDDSTGRRVLTRLSAAMGATARADKAAAATGGTAAAQSACARLASAVTAAETSPAIPDPAAARWLTRALARLQESAADCQAGASSDDAALINKGTAAMIAGEADLGRATAAIKTLDGS